MTLLCLILTFIMEKSEFYQFYYVQLVENQKDENKSEDQRSVWQKYRQLTLEIIHIYTNLGASVWNYIIITFLNFTATLCAFPAVVLLAESYEYKNSKYSYYFSNKRLDVNTLV